MSLSESSPKTVEQRSREIATQRQQRILSQEETVFRFLHAQDYHAFTSPRLTPGDPEMAIRQPFLDDLRYDPINGEIYTSVWRNMKTDEFINDQGEIRRKIKFPKRIKYRNTGENKDNYNENYVSLPNTSLNGELSGVGNPEDLPITGNVRRLIMMRVWDGLEPAIRQQGHVLDNYDPSKTASEPQLLRNMLYWFDKTSTKLREEQIGKEDLDLIALEAAKMVTFSNLPNAINETKQKIASMSLKAANIDSLGRVNPLAARTRLSSARVAAIERILISELISSKFSANAGVLYAERYVTRKSMTQASEELKAIQDQLINGDVSYQARIDMARKISQLAREDLRIARVAPYLIPSRMASVFLAGKRSDDDMEVLGKDFTDEVILQKKGDESFIPVNYLITEGHSKEAYRQISWATSIIDDILKETEEIFPPDNKKLDQNVLTEGVEEEIDP